MCRRLGLSVRGSVIIKGVETEYSEVGMCSWEAREARVKKKKKSCSHQCCMILNKERDD